MAPVIAVDLVAGHSGDGLLVTQDLTAQRVSREVRVGEHAVHQVVGGVDVHGDLFEHHLAFGVHVRAADQRAGHHVTDDVHRKR